MPMRVTRSEFLQKLEAVQSGLSPRGIIEQSNCFVFKNGQVITYNDEIACRATSGLPADLTVAVQAQSLIKILSKLPEDELELEMDSGELFVKGKGKWVGIVSQAEITLPVDKIAEPTEWLKLPDDFGDAVSIVKDCAGKDASRFVSTCINVYPGGLEATDGYKIARYRTKLPVTRSTLVKMDALKHVIPLDMTEVGETNDWLHFRNPAGLLFSCRRYLDPFPNIAEWLSVDGKEIALPKGLIEACDRAGVFSEENADNDEITVIIQRGKIKVKSQGVTGRYYESKEISYDGDAMDFTISPQLLSELTKKYNSCIVGKDRIKVEGDRFVYVTAIGAIEEDES